MSYAQLYNIITQTYTPTLFIQLCSLKRKCFTLIISLFRAEYVLTRGGWVKFFYQRCGFHKIALKCTDRWSENSNDLFDMLYTYVLYKLGH